MHNWIPKEFLVTKTPKTSQLISLVNSTIHAWNKLTSSIQQLLIHHQYERKHQLELLRTHVILTIGSLSNKIDFTSIREAKIGSSQGWIISAINETFLNAVNQNKGTPTIDLQHKTKHYNHIQPSLQMKKCNQSYDESGSSSPDFFSDISSIRAFSSRSFDSSSLSSSRVHWHSDSVGSYKPVTMLWRWKEGKNVKIILRKSVPKI